ncbi:MAG: leukotriene A4 hydrolase C-terminal domain-containing protein, partial [Tahibacter sp.]
VDKTRAAWLAGTAKAASLSGNQWSTQEWVRFLEGMPATLSTAQLTELDAALHFSGTPNGEIAQRWYPLTVRSGYAAARPELEKFLIAIGRRKLIMPTWEALTAKPEDLVFARTVFAKAKPGYHPITTASVTAALDKVAKK